MRRTIASMRIANITDLADSSDYRVEAIAAANPVSGDPARNTRCTVFAHDRKQSVWALLAKACHEIIKADYDDRRERANDLSVEVKLATTNVELPGDVLPTERDRRPTREGESEQ